MGITANGDARPREEAEQRVRGRPRWQFTAPAVLLLLSEGPSHGYELLHRLRPMMPPNAGSLDASGLYRLLRHLEAEGSLRSCWSENPGPGPARHVYELTDSGQAALDSWAASIAGELHAMSGLLATYHAGGHRSGV